MMDILNLVRKYTSGYGEIRHTVMKEILHYELLNCLFQDSNAVQSLAFSGGTALRLCYGGMRYSEDLDFCIIDGKEFDFEIMEKFAIDIKKQIKEKFGLDTVVKNESRNKADEMVQRWSTKVAVIYPKKEQEKQPIINIEISRFKCFDASFKQVRRIYEENESAIILNVESLEEIFVGKIIAFGHRRGRNTKELEVKYRDVWDLKFLIDNNVKLDMDLFVKKINDSKQRNKGKLQDNLIIKLEMLNEPQSSSLFFTELKRFLNKQDYDRIVSIDYFGSVKKDINRLINGVIDNLDAIEQEQESKPQRADEILFGGYKAIRQEQENKLANNASYAKNTQADKQKPSVESDIDTNTGPKYPKR